MDRAETLKIMSLFRAAYPRFYEGKKKHELENIVSLWQEMFPEPYFLVSGAVKALLQTDVKGFPPTIGQVKEKIRLIAAPERMSEQEAWNLVSKAVSNSIYNSEEEFEKLPRIIQRLVHAPSQLRQWAVADIDEFNTVIASNFMRSFRAKSKDVSELESLSPDVQAMAFRSKPEMQALCEEKPIGWAKPFEPGPEELEAIRFLMEEE